MFRKTTATSVAAFFLAFLTLLSSMPAAASANLGITPLNLILPAANLATSLEVTNNGDKAATLQADLFTWQLQNSKDVLTPTRELFVSPPIFKIAPGQKQIVRVGRLKPSVAGATDVTYRMFLTEVAPDVQARQNIVATVLRLNIPIFVPAAKPVAAALNWKAAHGSGDQLTLVAENPTNAALKIVNLTLLQNGEVVASQDVLLYVLNHSAREYVWNNALKLAKPGRPVELVARIERRRKTLSQILDVGAVSVVPQ